MLVRITFRPAQVDRFFVIIVQNSRISFQIVNKKLNERKIVVDARIMKSGISFRIKHIHIKSIFILRPQAFGIFCKDLHNPKSFYFKLTSDQYWKEPKTNQPTVYFRTVFQNSSQHVLWLFVFINESQNDKHDRVKHHLSVKSDSEELIKVQIFMLFFD